MTGRRGREAIEVTTGDTGAVREIQARMGRTDEDGIDHGQGPLESAGVKRIDIVKGRREGSGQAPLTWIEDNANRIDLIERKPSPNQRNRKRRVCKKQIRKCRRDTIQIL